MINLSSSSKQNKEEKKEVVFYTHFEEVLARIRPFGPFQIFCCIVILYATIEWAGNATFMDTLGSVEPDWNCTFADGSYQIVTSDDPKKCDIIKTCAHFTAVREGLDFFSLRADFKLICDNDHVMDIALIMAGGSLVGALVGGHLGDYFGRLTIFFPGQLLIIITSMMATAGQDWISFSLIMLVNCLLYGLMETTSLTLMMEYTSNKFRLIHAACFQWPIAYMVMSLVAYLTGDWQTYFVFLNLVASPLAIGFMLFHESPRWQIARNRLDEACNVLNDIAHERWNNTKAKFTTRDISTITKGFNGGLPFYHVGHLFYTRRLRRQTLMQVLSVITYALVSETYLYTTVGLNADNAIMNVFLDGVFRIFTPFIIIFLDFRFKRFGRKMQFIGALILEGLLFAVIIVLLAVGFTYNGTTITILTIVATMINDCVFWINIIQITTQRYPTVIRCIAFGFIQSIKHLGTIVGILALKPLLSSWTIGAFIVPEVFIIVTLFAGMILQPESKGKALMDQMIEANYGRLENAIPKALIKLAAGHKVQQMERRQELRKELEAHEAAVEAGKIPHSPWVYKGIVEEERDRKASVISQVLEDVQRAIELRHPDFEVQIERNPSMLSVASSKASRREYENKAFEEDDLTDRYRKEFKEELARKYHERDLEVARSRRESKREAKDDSDDSTGQLRL